MILRPVQPAPPSGAEVLPAWSVVERLQRQPYDACWMITQPSHAALAGEFAAKMKSANISQIDGEIIRAISLHDAGWGIPDAQAIMQSRSVGKNSPKSFIECSVDEFLFAWEKSIDIAESAGPAGGYIVSRHFARLAEHSIGQLAGEDREKEARFLQHEAERQKQLAAKQSKNTEELELLTDVLQFCDLLSLYICCGAQESVEFPKYFGVKVQVSLEGESYRLEPSLIEPGSEFKVAALKHPATKSESGREIEVIIGK
jgi:hypothetical protein